MSSICVLVRTASAGSSPRWTLNLTIVSSPSVVPHVWLIVDDHQALTSGTLAGAPRCVTSAGASVAA
jgi:hypothetical protein